MKWYWYIIIYLIIEFILHIIVNHIARKKGIYEIMKTISNKEAKEEFNVLYFLCCTIFFGVLMFFGSSTVLCVIFFVLFLIFVPFCYKLAAFMKAMELKKSNAKVDYSMSGKEKNRIDAQEDIKDTINTLGIFSIVSSITRKK